MSIFPLSIKHEENELDDLVQDEVATHQELATNPEYIGLLIRSLGDSEDFPIGICTTLEELGMLYPHAAPRELQERITDTVLPYLQHADPEVQETAVLALVSAATHSVVREALAVVRAGSKSQRVRRLLRELPGVPGVPVPAWVNNLMLPGELQPTFSSEQTAPLDGNLTVGTTIFYWSLFPEESGNFYLMLTAPHDQEENLLLIRFDKRGADDEVGGFVLMRGLNEEEGAVGYLTIPRTAMILTEILLIDRTTLTAEHANLLALSNRSAVKYDPESAELWNTLRADVADEAAKAAWIELLTKSESGERNTP